MLQKVAQKKSALKVIIYSISVPFQRNDQWLFLVPLKGGI